MGVEQAGGRLDDARGTAVSLNLEDLVGGGVGDDGDQLDDDILGHHVEDELEGQLVLVAGRDGDVVPDGRQVAEDVGAGGGVVGQLGRGLEHAADERDLNWRLLVVGDLDQGLGDAAVDDLDAKDVGIGESRLDVGLELGLRDGRRGAGLIGLGELGVSNCIRARDTVRSEKGGNGAKGAGWWRSRACTARVSLLRTSAAKPVATRRASRAREDHLKLTIVPDSAEKGGDGDGRRERRRAARWERVSGKIQIPAGASGDSMS